MKIDQEEVLDVGVLEEEVVEDLKPLELMNKRLKKLNKNDNFKNINFFQFNNSST